MLYFSHLFQCMTCSHGIHGCRLGTQTTFAKRNRDEALDDSQINLLFAKITFGTDQYQYIFILAL